MTDGSPDEAPRDDRARRHVDKFLADDFDFDDERDPEDENRYAPDPPRRQEPEAPPAPPRTHPCWSCAAAVPSGSPACPECQESPRHLRLISTRPPVDVRHGIGAPLHLGRHPIWAAPAVAAALDDTRGVSRRHATIEMAPDGTVWLTEHPPGTTNGTYVNDARIPPGTRVPLTDGDTVGLGRNCALHLLLVEPPA